MSIQLPAKDRKRAATNLESAQHVLFMVSGMLQVLRQSDVDGGAVYPESTIQNFADAISELLAPLYQVLDEGAAHLGYEGSNIVTFSTPDKPGAA